MKRISSILAVLAVLSLASFASAAKADKAAKGAGKAARAEALRGVVTAVDLGTKTLKVKGQDGAEVEVATDANTAITVNKAAATFQDIKQGMRVMVNPGKGTAKKIVAQDARAGKGGGGKGGAKGAKKAQ